MALKKSKKLVSTDSRPSGLIISSILLAVHVFFAPVVFLAVLPFFTFMMPSSTGVFSNFMALLFFLVLALPFLILQAYTAYSLYNKKPWSRIVATIFAAFMLLSFPFFTIFGLIILYFLWFDEPTKKVFPS